MEALFIFVVTVFLSVGITEEIVVPAATKAVEVATPIVESAIEAGTELITGAKTD
jgi:hypothetical protein